MKRQQTNVERFYNWIQRINNQFLHDHTQMVNAFHIVATQDVNDIEVIEPIIITPN